MTALVRQLNPKEAAGQPYLMFTDPILDLPSFSKEPTCFLHHQPSSSSSGDAPLPCGLFLRPSKPPLSIRAPPQLSPDSPAALSPRDTPQAPYPGPECSISLPHSSGHGPESGSVPPLSLPGDLRGLPSASSLATSLPCPAPDQRACLSKETPKSPRAGVSCLSRVTLPAPLHRRDDAHNRRSVHTQQLDSQWLQSDQPTAPRRKVISLLQMLILSL